MSVGPTAVKTKHTLTVINMLTVRSRDDVEVDGPR
eukprot:CAMPEP_0119094534 /NCGR_PEP_ID=MMETSP1178-20130426/166472_1 /TAXON_ID=33656 /ORGANISM="unid sp, Strain CCMP2000" /LENGTH=34 /DNA_ID= /DNA_START= /DNA_END= /DNA_ORIENTATION=